MKQPGELGQAGPWPRSMGEAHQVRGLCWAPALDAEDREPLQGAGLDAAVGVDADHHLGGGAAARCRRPEVEGEALAAPLRVDANDHLGATLAGARSAVWSAQLSATTSTRSPAASSGTSEASVPPMPAPAPWAGTRTARRGRGARGPLSLRGGTKDASTCRSSTDVGGTRQAAAPASTSERAVTTVSLRREAKRAFSCDGPPAAPSACAVTTAMR